MLAAQDAYADVAGYHYASSSPAALEATPARMTTLVSWVRRRVGLLVPVFKFIVCWRLASSALRQFLIRL